MLLIIVTSIYVLYVLVRDWVPLGRFNDMERAAGPLPLGAAICVGLYIVVFAVLAWMS